MKIHLLQSSSTGSFILYIYIYILYIPKRSVYFTNGAFPLHGTVQYGSLLGSFPLGTVPGTW